MVEDLGAPPEALFAQFGRDPIASASLAQVHEAVDHDGRRLAVKVRGGGSLALVLPRQAALCPAWLPVPSLAPRPYQNRW